MSYIKREPLLKILNGLYDHHLTMFNYAADGATKDCIEAVIEAPTADVVEVVRCKDCVNWGGVTYGFVCRKFSGIDTKICMGAEHYCSYGERSENGT